MENKNKLNPLISGGILVNDNDYFEKDKINMEKDSLKASLALLTKLKNQKKGEIEAFQNTYLTEESTPNTQNDTQLFDIPTHQSFEVSSNLSTSPKSFSVSEEKPNSETAPSFKLNADNNQNTNSMQNLGISLQDLNNQNQNDFISKKDEYVPDYRSEEYQQQAQNNLDQIQTPLYSVSQTDPIDTSQLITDDAIQTEEEPKYIIGENNKDNTKNITPVSTTEEIKSGKGIAWLAYIIFFIPLLFNSKNKYIRWHANEGLELFFLDILGAGLFCLGWFLKSSNEIYTLLLLASLTAGSVIIIVSVFTRLLMIPFALAGKEVQHPWLLRKHRIIK